MQYYDVVFIQFSFISILFRLLFYFYPPDVVSAVYATATWLAGWLAGCLSHAGIASKRLNLGLLKTFSTVW